MRFAIVGFLAICLAITGCSSSGEKKKRKREFTDKEYYQQASDSLNNGNYLQAIEKLQQLEARYPFGKYAEQAQLEQVYAYFQMQDMEMAKARAERFIRLHPQHEKVDYAIYMRGMATYYLGMGLIERYLADEQGARDPEPAREAFDIFAELVNRFPETPYVDEARQRMIYLRNRLAMHEIHVARYYLKRNAFVAALNRGMYVIENYQRTPSTQDALAVMVEAYQYLELEERANETLKILKDNFPNHPQLDDKGNFVKSGWAEKEHKSLLNVVTFGLLG